MKFTSLSTHWIYMKMRYLIKYLQLNHFLDLQNQTSVLSLLSLSSYLKYFSIVKYQTKIFLCFSLIFKISNQFLLTKNLIPYQTTICRIMQLILYLELSLSLLRCTLYLLQNNPNLMYFLLRISTLVEYISGSSLWMPQYFFTEKNSSLHLVQDYRSLNVITVKNKYSLPLISELISQLQEVRYFTKLDVHWSFNNI